MTGADWNMDSPASAARFQAVQQVRAYWEALRQYGDVPKRDRIDPRGLAEHLEQVFLIERIGAGLAKFRLAGLQLHDLMGMDMRGMPLSALVGPSSRQRLAESVEQVFSAPGTSDLWLTSAATLGRPGLQGRMVLLPLIGSQGRVNLALGCLSLGSAIGRAPRRFEITTQMTAPLGCTAGPTTSEPTAQDRPLPRPPRGHPHLRLVSSRD